MSQIAAQTAPRLLPAESQRLWEEDRREEVIYPEVDGEGDGKLGAG